MLIHWAKIEPVAIATVIGCLGWALVEITSAKVNIARIDERTIIIQKDVTEIKKDIKVYFADLTKKSNDNFEFAQKTQ